MFGHQDEDQNQAGGSQVAVASEPQDSENTAAVSQQAKESTDTNLPESPATDQSAPSEPESSSLGPDDTQNSDDNTDTPQVQSDDSTPVADDKLLDIKKQALGELSPLVDHLDQSPEEKFKTTMMMIQAADNQALIPDAYKAAKDISDEKARAQALLDIVNEINYFTHKS